ncbi:glycosyltransferase family 2 protein [Desulfosediminicola ganghwensis]|uniref:glycosyltransferase family 2 protein n=1 Tax=Desulfosediminicola ganghwensis TaxID=2569540 RepID=UPI0010AB5A85|nr:glycosyltransferase family 2 protein [Desulfosediminicola ganghwensis]
MREKPIIEVIIPSWNGRNYLAGCLRSLKEQSCSAFSVTVVDNGSCDDTEGFLREYHPWVRLIRFEQNQGFSAAVNAGIKAGETDWYLLLNNDTEIARDCIEVLGRAIQQYPGYDFFSLKMMSYHQRQVLDGAGDAVLRGGAGYKVGTLEEDKGQFAEDRDVFGACAGAALYNRRFFDKVGLFDEDFFAYLEDVDLNMRAARAGLKCRFLSQAVVYHIGSASSGSKINPFTIRLSTRNNINVLVKNYPISLLWRFLPAILFYQIMWLCFVIKKRQLKAYLKGVAGALLQLTDMKRKREQLYLRNLLSVEDFGGALIASEREAVQSIISRRSAQGKGNRLLHTYSKWFL